MAISGFSDRVTLGSFGTIQESDEVVMRVKFDGAAVARENTYFRGIALDTFDNKAWSRSLPRSVKPFEKAEPRGGLCADAPTRPLMHDLL